MVAKNVGASTMTLSPGLIMVLPSKSKRLLAAGGDDEAVGGDRDAFVGHEFAQALAQRAKALGRAILQHGAGVVGQNSGGGFGDAFHVKQRRVRKAARKADDAGFAQQFEEFADGGGFYVVQAVGKLHGCSELLSD